MTRCVAYTDSGLSSPLGHGEPLTLTVRSLSMETFIPHFEGAIFHATNSSEPISVLQDKATKPDG